MRFQFSLLQLLLLVVIVIAINWIAVYLYYGVIFKLALKEAIENASIAGETTQREKIVAALKSSNMQSIRLPTIADARWYTMANREETVIAIDWICSSPNVRSIRCGLSNGRDWQINFDNVINLSHGTYYRHTIIQTKHLPPTSLGGPGVVQNVAFITDGKISNVVTVRGDESQRSIKKCEPNEKNNAEEEVREEDAKVCERLPDCAST